MKKILSIAVAATAMLVTTACVSEDRDLMQNLKEAGKGYIALNVTNDDALTTRTVNDAPSTWTVALGGQASHTLTVGTIAGQSLAAGDYTVEVYNYANEAAALAANSNYGDARYYGDLGITGASQKVTVSAGATTTASLALGKAKNAKFTINATVPESAVLTVTATSGSGDNTRALTFSKAANGSFDRTTAYFPATDDVTIGVVYNGVTLNNTLAKTLTMAGAGTENTLAITTNGNGSISLTITYDDEFTAGNTQTINFDAATGKALSVTNSNN